MKFFRNPLAPATLTTLGALCIAWPAAAQVAGGTTTVEASITESTTLAMGWRVKKTLLGKSVDNEAGQTVGKVQDLIISPERSVSYVIVGAGGFVGIGRHDVAIPVTRIQDKAGKLVMAGATKESVKAMPAVAYAAGTGQRDAFVAALQADVASADAELAVLKHATALRSKEFEAGGAATARLRKSIDKAAG